MALTGKHDGGGGVFTCRRTLHAWLTFCRQIGRMRVNDDADGGVYKQTARANREGHGEKNTKKKPSPQVLGSV